MTKKELKAAFAVIRRAVSIYDADQARRIDSLGVDGMRHRWLAERIEAKGEKVRDAARLLEYELLQICRE